MLYFFQLTFLALITVLLSLATILFGLFEAHGKRIYGINRLWTWLILRVGGISLKVEGLDNIDPQRPYIFIVNHQSNIDIPVLVQALRPFQLRWLAKKELLRVPFFGWAMWAAKHVTVDRKDPRDALKSLARAKERLAAGISLVVFPEGTRSRTGALQRFKKGGFLLAVQTQTPVVPIAISGSGALLPADSWRLGSGIVKVVIEKPVAVEGFRPGNLRLLSNQVRDVIAGHLNHSIELARRDGESIEPSEPLRVRHQAMEKQGI
ncbi:MAG: 1-acyl-sn-glycerol-3-phosphate acyltransferase [Deltaproteobacteria bacterium]|nr:1-acyl-sn-glycerol-3-phosphate acyltransferase [Deltaproteobacteria bacterium]